LAGRAGPDGSKRDDRKEVTGMGPHPGPTDFLIISLNLLVLDIWRVGRRHTAAGALAINVVDFTDSIQIVYRNGTKKLHERRQSLKVGFLTDWDADSRARYQLCASFLRQ
jgi:hypothetical protein